MNVKIQLPKNVRVKFTETFMLRQDVVAGNGYNTSIACPPHQIQSFGALCT